jgi:hypothetical protein
VGDAGHGDLLIVVHFDGCGIRIELDGRGDRVAGMHDADEPQIDLGPGEECFAPGIDEFGEGGSGRSSPSFEDCSGSEW